MMAVCVGFRGMAVCSRLRTVSCVFCVLAGREGRYLQRCVCGFRDSIFITFLGEGTSIYGGLAVFSVLGYMAKMRDTGVEDVVTSGLSCLVSSHIHFVSCLRVGMS